MKNCLLNWNKGKKNALSLEEIITIARGIRLMRNCPSQQQKALAIQNKILKTGEANCIGYSALFNAIVNYLSSNSSN